MVKELQYLSTRGGYSSPARSEGIAQAETVARASRLPILRQDRLGAGRGADAACPLPVHGIARGTPGARLIGTQGPLALRSVRPSAMIDERDLKKPGKLAGIRKDPVALSMSDERDAGAFGLGENEVDLLGIVVVGLPPFAQDRS